MKKGKGHPPQRRIVGLTPEAHLDSNFADADKLGTKRAITVIQSIVINASTERCFEFVSKQLEETPHWDPTIMHVHSISSKHVRVGYMSRVNFNFRGTIEEATVMIRSFQPNKAISWTSTHSSQLQEKWHFQPDPYGTLVTITLGYNRSGWFFGRLIEKTMMKNKVRKDVLDMLDQLKLAIEKLGGAQE